MIIMSNVDLADLIDKFRRQTLTEEERVILQRWLGAHEENRIYFEKITAPGVIEEMARAVLDINMAAIHRKFEKRRRKL